jgi:putative phosphoribosyl transferase
MATLLSADITERPVTIPASGTRLAGILVVPSGAQGVVLFAHGSGSGRHSPRNNFVAQVLQVGVERSDEGHPQGGLATLLIDLLEEREAADRSNVFDIDLLADRLLAATEWLQEQPGTRALPIGYVGASTGAGAALQAAARAPEAVGGIVSRGGRPDLAGPYLSQVQAPTLLIVGGWDTPVIGMNEAALAQLNCPKEMVIVPGATHLFEEPGTLEEVAHLARRWFQHHLTSQARSQR